MIYYTTDGSTPGTASLIYTGPFALTSDATVRAIAIADGYTHILGPSTTFGRDLMPRIAALLGVNQVSDISAVEDAYHFKRPIYAGNAIVDVHAPEAVKMVATVRVASWKAAGNGGGAAAMLGQHDL